MNRICIGISTPTKGDLNTISSTPHKNNTSINYIDDKLVCMKTRRAIVSMSTPNQPKINAIKLGSNSNLKNSLFNISKTRKKVSFSEEGPYIIRVECWKRFNLLISKRYSGPEDKCTCRII